MDYIRDTREKCFVVNDEYLNGYAKLCGIYATGVYLSLCRHASKEQVCFPSKKLISDELQISEREVYRGLKKLAKWNIVKIESQGRKEDGSFLNNTYTLLDKSVWKKKPQACQSHGEAVGLSEQLPQAYHDISRRPTSPKKDTHMMKDTHIKDTHSEIPAKAGTPQAELSTGSNSDVKDLSGNPPPISARPPLTLQQEFVKNWAELYQSETGKPFKVDRKDFIIVANLLKRFGEAEVSSRAKILFFACKRRSLNFTKNGMADFSIGSLSYFFNKLLPDVEKSKNEITMENWLKKEEEKDGKGEVYASPDLSV